MQAKLLLFTFIWMADCVQFLLDTIWTDVKFLDGSVFKNRIRSEFRLSAHPYLLLTNSLHYCHLQDCSSTRLITTQLFVVHAYALWCSWSSGRDRTRNWSLRVRFLPGPLQATSRKFLTYCVLRPTQPPTLSGQEMISSLLTVGYGVKA